VLAIAAGSALLLLLSACGGDAAQAGDTVSVHYTGTLDDGSVFDSSEGHDSLKFELGSGQVINGFDAAVMGLSIGEELTVRIEPADAYGEWNPAGVVDIPRTATTGDVSVGNIVTSDLNQMAEVIAVTHTTITIDLNHVLAGEALTFAIELVQIEE
jgi:peptidylprolyl isomerase